MSARLALFATCIFLARPLFAHPCDYIGLTIVSFSVDEAAARADTTVACYNSFMEPYNGSYSAKAWISDSASTAVIAEESCLYCPSAYWNGTLRGSAFANRCYRCSLRGSSATYNNEIASAEHCVPPPADDGGGGTDDQGDGCNTTDGGCGDRRLS